MHGWDKECMLETLRGLCENRQGNGVHLDSDIHATRRGWMLAACFWLEMYW